MQRRIYLIFALIALIAWGLVVFLRQGFEGGLKQGSDAPNFELIDLKGQKISLQSLRGKAVILNFWASWCDPCRKEMPSLEALYQRYRDRGLVVVGVSLDEGGKKAVEDFLQVIPVTFPILLDPQQQTSTLYPLKGLPESFFINPEGKIMYKVVGEAHYDQSLFYQRVEGILPKSQSSVDS